MSENAKKNLEAISDKLKDIPEEVAAAVIDQYAVRMEGFAEGFAAGKAHKASKVNFLELAKESPATKKI